MEFDDGCWRLAVGRLVGCVKGGGCRLPDRG